jgi:Na+/melibiose symporter-like transporter
MKQNTVVFVIVTLISLAAVISTYSLKSIDAWLLPRIICYVVLILSLAGTVKSILEEIRGEESADKHVKIFKKEELKPLLEMLAWLLGFVFAIYFFGFYPSILVFAFAYMKRRKRCWLTAALYSVILTGVLYVIFRYGLSARLHEGLLFMRRW